MNKLIYPSIVCLGLCMVLIQACKNDTDPDFIGEVPLQILLANPGDEIEVEVDPHKIAPLTAMASFETDPDCKVHVLVKGDIPVEFEYEDFRTDHRVPILGLYQGQENEVILTLSTADGAYARDTLLITTDSLASYYPEITIDAADAASMEPGMTFVDLEFANFGSFHSTPMAFDHAGEIRWMLDLGFMGKMAWPLQRFANGNLFITSQDDIYEFTMLGEQVQKWTVGGYHIHHDLIEMPNGNFLAAVSKGGATIINSNGEVATIEDHVIEIDRNNGSVVHEWDLREVLDVDRNVYIDGNGDWYHNNAIWYSESDDCLLVSGRHQGMAKISRDNELVWIIAPHKGWGKAGRDGTGFETSDFLLTAVDFSGQPYDSLVQAGDLEHQDFNWGWGQHALMLLPSGNLLCYDNGDIRNFGNASINHSRIVEYAIDEQAMTIQQIWEFGKIRNEELYARIVSDVDMLPETKNRLMVSGIVNSPTGPKAKIVEVTYPGATEIFEATLNFKNVRSSGQPAWGQLDLLYRGERMGLYP